MCPQALSTEGSWNPEASDHWRQSQNTSRGVAKQVRTVDLGWERAGEQKEFHFHRPSLLGSPQSETGTGHCPQEGLESDRELRIGNEKLTHNFQNNLEANTRVAQCPYKQWGGWGSCKGSGGLSRFPAEGPQSQEKAGKAALQGSYGRS